jgi:hypothetical protein
VIRTPYERLCAVVLLILVGWAAVEVVMVAPVIAKHAVSHTRPER